MANCVATLTAFAAASYVDKTKAEKVFEDEQSDKEARANRPKTACPIVSVQWSNAQVQWRREEGGIESEANDVPAVNI